MSAIGWRATPDCIAASATAGATQSSTRWSNGFGIRYSRPKRNDWPPYAFETESGTSIFASAASACDAARFIASLISVARTSSAPRKMNGKPSTLLTWFGIVAAARRHDDVRPRRLRVLGRDLGVGIREREDDRVARHALQHLALDDPAGRRGR